MTNKIEISKSNRKCEKCLSLSEDNWIISRQSGHILYTIIICCKCNEIISVEEKYLSYKNRGRNDIN